MTSTLGFEPLPMDVVLSPGANFTGAIRRTSGDWDDGTTLELHIDDSTVWAATIDGDTAFWNVASTDVDAVIAGKPRRHRVWYTAAGAPLLWFSGPVNVRG